MGNMVEGKVVVVTGSGSGIGRDLALAFAANGAKVVVNDVSPGKDGAPGAADKVVAEIRAAGGEAVASTDSVAVPEAAAKIVQAAVDSFGRIDCVVNNAGIVRDRFFFNMSVDEWKAVVGVHLNGSFYVARAAAPHFKQQSLGIVRPHDVDVRADRQLSARPITRRPRWASPDCRSRSRSTWPSSMSARTASRRGPGRR